jgi:hypothetical protein
MTRVLAGFILIVMMPGVARAQGAGSTGAQVLQFLAGGRASALSGAFTAISGDVDALFYNPAGAASLRLGAGLAYETYVEDISLASFAGALKLGPVSLGLSALFLDGGEVREVVPDPLFGGNTGMATERSVSATEGIARLSFAMPLNDRLRVGASAGFVFSSIAEVSRGTPSVDLGAQYDLAFGSIGISLLNAGGSLSGDSVADADLPTEARVGAAVGLNRPDGLGVQITGDVVARLRESSAGFLIGAEAGYRATAQRALGAVARVGFSGADGDGALSSLRLGAGLTVKRVAVDYTYQNLDFYGAVHRFGVRWTELR